MRAQTKFDKSLLKQIQFGKKTDHWINFYLLGILKLGSEFWNLKPIAAGADLGFSRGGGRIFKKFQKNFVDLFF